MSFFFFFPEKESEMFSLLRAVKVTLQHEEFDMVSGADTKIVKKKK